MDCSTAIRASSIVKRWFSASSRSFLSVSEVSRSVLSLSCQERFVFVFPVLQGIISPMSVQCCYIVAFFTTVPSGTRSWISTSPIRTLRARIYRQGLQFLCCFRFQFTGCRNNDFEQSFFCFYYLGFSRLFSRLRKQ